MAYIFTKRKQKVIELNKKQDNQGLINNHWATCSDNAKTTENQT